MIIFFDALLIDDESLLGLRQTKRFERLEQLITRRTRHAELVQRQIIDLDRHLGVSHLRKALAESIVNREEGLVLKPDEPYFHFGRQAERKYPSCPIKVKKDYFKGLGDIGDFAVVGARYDAVSAKSYNIPGLKWTQFFLGCLKNKNAVLLHQEKPMFVVIESVELNPTQLKNFIHFANPNSVDLDEHDAFELTVPKRFSGSKGIRAVFKTPPVFDISSFSFSLEGNTGFHTPRFPQVTKIHYERDFMDTVTFDELMSMAEKARTLAAPDDSQEMLEWMATLEAADPRGRAVDAASQSTAWSGFTPSPRSCSTRQSTSQEFLSGSPTRPERIHSIQHATARPESVPVQSPTPAPLLWVLGPAGRPTTARNPAAPSLPPRAGQVAGDFSAPGNLKRGSASPSTTTTVENKRPRTQSLENPPPLSTTSSPAIKQTATMATSAGNPSIPANQVLPPPQGAVVPAVDDDDGPSILDQLTTGDSADEDFFEIDEDTVDDEVAAPSLPPFLPGRCRYLGGRCSMPGRSVLLSPCVKNHLLVTQTLLPSHGITEWITDPREWAQNAAQGIVVQAGTPPREAEDDNLPAQPLPQPRPRSKICFVECRHTQETRDFVDKIEALELTLADGGHDWVEIFDWRALEVMLVIEEDMYEGKAVPENPAGDVYKYFCGLA
jgi:DNA ligase 4